jgi:hypothetical protein
MLDAVAGRASAAAVLAAIGRPAVGCGEDWGERRPALSRSTDGVSRAAEALAGPTLDDPFLVQAMAATDVGAIGVSEALDALTVWRFET